MTMVSTLMNALADAPQLVVLTGLLVVAAWIVVTFGASVLIFRWHDS